MVAKKYNRNFLFLVLGQIGSVFGSAVLRFALDLYVLDLTGRADVFAFVMAISFVPYIVLAPIGGAIADRFNRRNLLVTIGLIDSGLVTVLLLLFMANQATVAWITVIMLLLSVVSAIDQPTVQSSTPLLVGEENLAGANGIVGSLNSLSNVFAPILGGVLYATLGINSLILVSVIVFVLAALLEMMIQMPFEKQPQEQGIVRTILQDVKSGIHFMIHEKPIILKLCFMGALLNIIISAFFIVGTPYILRVVMKSSDSMYSIGLMLSEMGAIVGALSMGKVGNKLNIGSFYKWVFAIAISLLPMALAVSKGMLGLGHLPSFVLYCIFALIIMALACMISIYVITKVQKETPNELLGKIMSIIFAVTGSTLPLGQMIFGNIIQGFNQTIFLVILLVSLLTAAFALLTKKLLSTEKD